jgi:hypothetical protein
MTTASNLAYTICIRIELGIGICVFVVLFYITAPYGRHYRKGWGITVTEKFAWMFMIANLLPRAIAHHRWYANNFPDYPKERKAIIPFIL